MIINKKHMELLTACTTHTADKQKGASWSFTVAMQPPAVKINNIPEKSLTWN